jgi:N-acylneuraminate cytidylyltransferase
VAVSAVALVPARAGSKRVPGKNILPLAGRPLIAYSIDSARDSGVFTEILVSTDSDEIGDVARDLGATVIERPAEIAGEVSPDIEWVLHAMKGRTEDAFAILRPTSPFRTTETILRAWQQLLELGDRADSIRAVDRVRQHPAKMWIVEGELMRPVIERPDAGTPWHSMQFQSLPEVWVQNSSLEIAWRHVLDGDAPSISGTRVAPFFTEGDEGLSIDYPEDVARAEAILAALARPGAR